MWSQQGPGGRVGGRASSPLLFDRPVAATLPSIKTARRLYLPPHCSAAPPAQTAAQTFRPFLQVTAWSPTIHGDTHSNQPTLSAFSSAPPANAIRPERPRHPSSTGHTPPRRARRTQPVRAPKEVSISWELGPSSPLPISTTTFPDFLPRICIEFYATSRRNARDKQPRRASKENWEADKLDEKKARRQQGRRRRVGSAVSSAHTLD